MRRDGGREGLRVTHHHTCAHIVPPLPPSLQPTPPTETKSVFTHCTHAHRWQRMKEVASTSVCQGSLSIMGKSRLEQWIKHLFRAAIPDNTVLTIRVDIQRKWLKACANYHVSVSTYWFLLSRSDRSQRALFYNLDFTCWIENGYFSAGFDPVHQLFAHAWGVMSRLL